MHNAQLFYCLLILLYKKHDTCGALSKSLIIADKLQAYFNAEKRKEDKYEN